MTERTRDDRRWTGPNECQFLSRQRRGIRGSNRIQLVLQRQIWCARFLFFTPVSFLDLGMRSLRRDRFGRDAQDRRAFHQSQCSHDLERSAGHGCLQRCGRILWHSARGLRGPTLRHEQGRQLGTFPLAPDDLARTSSDIGRQPPGRSGASQPVFLVRAHFVASIVRHPWLRRSRRRSSRLGIGFFSYQLFFFDALERVFVPPRFCRLHIRRPDETLVRSSASWSCCLCVPLGRALPGFRPRYLDVAATAGVATKVMASRLFHADRADRLHVDAQGGHGQRTGIRRSSGRLGASFRTAGESAWGGSFQAIGHRLRRKPASLEFPGLFWRLCRRILVGLSPWPTMARDFPGIVSLCPGADRNHSLHFALRNGFFPPGDSHGLFASESQDRAIVAHRLERAACSDGRCFSGALVVRRYLT